MPSLKPSRPAAPTTPVGNLKPLVLRAATGRESPGQAARRPLVPTHASGTADHARHHVARSAQS